MNQTQERLSPEQALQVLGQVAGQVKVTLQEGDVIKQALQVIYELVENSKPKEEGIKGQDIKKVK